MTHQELATSRKTLGAEGLLQYGDHPPGVSPEALDWNAAEPPKVNPIVFLDRVAPQPSAECFDNDSYGNPESSPV